MRVVFNRQPTLGARTGIGHYAAELLKAMALQAGTDEIDVYPTGLLWRLHACISGSAAGTSRQISSKFAAQGCNRGTLRNTVKRIVSMPAARNALRTLQPLKFRHFRGVCRRNKYDLYHEPNILPMPCDCPTISTLHDLSAIAHPEWHPADRVKQHERHLERALDQCTHILTGSDCTRAEIIRELGIAPSRVTRVYHGIREGLAPMPAEQVAAGLKMLGLPPTYLLHVGTLEPRKNLEMLVRAYCALPANLRERCPLLLVGKWGWNTKSLAELLAGIGRRSGVMRLGYIAEEHLSTLYGGARALLFPTLYEGFGLPPLEMMACGGAVITSTAGAVVEVVGENGHLIDAANLDGWREAMVRAIEDNEWVNTLRQGAHQRAASFTWQKCASNTFAVYRGIVRSPLAQSLAA